MPWDLPEVPEPVNEADAGDAKFEAVQAYMDWAAEAANNGRKAEQVALLEALVAKEDKQPAAYFQLFQTYSLIDGQQETALKHLQRTVDLILSPQMALPSDPQSVTSDMPSRPHTPSYFFGQIVKEAEEFIGRHCVVGRGGQELQPIATLMEKLLRIAETKVENPEDFDGYYKSEFLHTLGIIYRKMELSDKAIEKLRLADLVVQDLDEHSYPSLMLIAEILNQQGVSSNDLDKIQQAVNQARLVKELMETNGHPNIYLAEILLA